MAILLGATPAQAVTTTWSSSASTSDWFTAGNWVRSPSGTPVAGDITYIGNTTPAGAATSGNVTIGSGSAAASQIWLGYATGTEGLLTVQSGANLNVTSSLSVGRLGSGTLNIAGGTASIGGTFSLGGYSGSAGGDGHLHISNGGTLNTTSTSSVVVGYLSGTPQSTVLIEGPGSTWNANSSVILGGRGSGSGDMVVRDGGLLNLTNPSNSGTNLGLGLADYTGSTGSLTITDPGSKVVSTPGIMVGIQGTGTVSVVNGATLETGSDLVDYDYLGYLAASSTAPRAEGHVVVDGEGSSWINHTGLVLGYTGIGTLTVSNGASVTSTYDSYMGINAITGAANAAHGEALITGDGSIWTTGTLDMALYNGADAVLTVTDGGTLKTTDAAGINSVGTGGQGTINIGAAQGEAAARPGTLDTSIVNLGAQGTLVFNHDSADYVFAPQIGSVAATNGTVDQLAGTTILTGDSNTFEGQTNVNGGILRVDGTLGNSVSSVVVASDATLGGKGTIGGNVTIEDGGILAPAAAGDVSTLTINGNLALNSGSILNYGFGQADTVGGTYNDLTVVNGDLTLAGTLNVAVTPGGTFLPGVYRVISYGGSLTDNGLALGTMPEDSIETVQTSVAGQVNLVVGSESQPLTFWDGDAGPHGDGAVNGGNGTWQSGAGNDNWTDSTGGQIGHWADQGFAVFMGTPGTVTADNSLGAVSASGMQFASDGYLVQGDDITLVGAASTPGQAIIRVGDGTSLGGGYTATINANLTGDAQLVKADQGTLVLDGNNSYSGGTALDGGTLQVSADHNLGAASGALSFDGGTLNTTADFATARDATLNAGGGTLDINAGTTLAMSGAIDGSGSLTKTGDGTLLLTGTANRYTGDTNVSGGTLQAGAANALGANSAVTVAAGATLDANGLDQTIAGLANAGKVNIASANTAAMPGAVLTVTGDYVGNNGSVALGTQWSDDSSLHDQLVIGGNASGSTALQVLHRGGGDGARTEVGINLVKVGGTSTADAFSLSPDSDGYRAGSTGVIASGPFNYTLRQGGNGGNANDWYLVSDGYRPEAGSYLDNQLVAMQSQLHTLHDRQSQAPGMIGDASNNPDANSWARVQGAFSHRNAGDFTANDDTYLLHLGSDVARWNVGEEGSLRVGAMGMFVHSSGTTTAQGSDRSNQKVDGASLGAYATWYGRKDTLTGPYVDAWFMGGAFDNKVTGSGLPEEKYRSNTYTASLETGYGFELHRNANENGSTRVILQPQVQVTASKYDADDHVEQGGTVVSDLNASAVTTRLGARLYADIQKGAGNDASRTRPFAEVNWLHSPDSHSVSLDGIGVRDKLPSDLAELKLGVEANVRPNLSLWGWGGVQAGNGYTNASINAGLRYSW